MKLKYSSIFIFILFINILNLLSQNYVIIPKPNEISFRKYMDHQLYISVPENCVVNYQGKDIIAFDFEITFIARIVHLS